MRCEDLPTYTGVVMARRTIEVRKPRDIGDAIRAVREARGISQEELAQANAYDRFYLYGWRRRARCISRVCCAR